MVEPIDKDKAAARAAKHAVDSGSHSSGSLSGGSGSGPAPLAKPFFQEDVHTIAEEDESEVPQRSQWLQTQATSRFAASSPGQLTPHGEEDDDDVSMRRRIERRTESPQPVGMGSLNVKKSTASAPAAIGHGHTSVPNPAPSFFDIPVPHASQDEAKKQEALGGSSRPQDEDKDGVLRKDTVLSPGEKAVREVVQDPPPEAQEEFSPEDWGLSFKIEWIRVGTLPFHRLRSLRNPWNADREVKVSRDGTEIEPGKRAYWRYKVRLIDSDCCDSPYRMGPNGPWTQHSFIPRLPLKCPLAYNHPYTMLFTTSLDVYNTRSMHLAQIEGNHYY